MCICYLPLADYVDSLIISHAFQLSLTLFSAVISTICLLLCGIMTIYPLLLAVYTILAY